MQATSNAPYFLCGGTSTGTSTETTGIVKAKTLNVRTGPGLGYGKIATLSTGATVTVYEQLIKEGMIWGRIGDNRWVCMSYVTLTSTGSTGSTGNGVMGTIARCFYAVNVRSAPGT
ncbi:MAG: SH3 domain-containing protein, partial [Clostridia bacterium]|nr:SH3 domain-containing protein [Clostridia bacterium]